MNSTECFLWFRYFIASVLCAACCCVTRSVNLLLVPDVQKSSGGGGHNSIAHNRVTHNDNRKEGSHNEHQQHQHQHQQQQQQGLRGPPPLLLSSADRQPQEQRRHHQHHHPHNDNNNPSTQKTNNVTTTTITINNNNNNSKNNYNNNDGDDDGVGGEPLRVEHRKRKPRALNLPVNFKKDNGTSSFLLSSSSLPTAVLLSSSSTSSSSNNNMFVNKSIVEALSPVVLTNGSTAAGGIVTQAEDLPAVSMLPPEDVAVHKELPLPLLIASPVAAVSIIIFVCVAYYCHSSQLDARARQLALKYAVISTEPPVCSRGVPSTSSVDIDLIRKPSLRPSTSRTSTPNPTPEGSKRGSVNWVAIGDQEVITYTAARRHSTFIL